VRPEVDASIRLALQRAVARRRLCRLHRSGLDGGPRGTEGLVVGLSHELVALHRVDGAIVLDGFQVLRWIRNNGPTQKIPVALFSASLISGDITKGYAEGANYFIIKPSALTTLIEIVRAADKFLVSDSRNSEALTQFSEPSERR